MGTQGIASSTCIVRDTAARKGRTQSVAPRSTAARHLHYGRIILDAGDAPLKFNTGELETGPIPKPAGDAVVHGFPYSDDFSKDRMGVQWSFYKGSESDRERYRYGNNALVLAAKGMTPVDSSPLWFVTGDHAYEVEVEIDADPGATAGLLLFYSRKLYAGLGFSSRNLIMHQYGTERPGAKPPHLGQRVFIRLRNDRHIVTMHYSADGRKWERFDRGIDVSGYRHNVAYDFLSLRPALYAAGAGEVRFRNFKYRALGQ